MKSDDSCSPVKILKPQNKIHLSNKAQPFRSAIVPQPDKKNKTRWINPIWCLPPFDSSFCPSVASRLITPNCFYASIYFALIAGAVKPANITPNWNHFTGFHLFGRLDIGLYYMQYITIHFFHPASGSTSQPWLWTISISSQLLQNVLQCYKSCDNWKHEGRLKMGWNKFASAQAEYKASIDLLI